MAIIPVASIDDPRIAHYRNLPGANLTRHSGRFIVEGHLLVDRLLASSYGVESVLVDGSRADRLPRGIPEEVPVFVTSPGLVQRIIGFNFHRGILACGHRKPRRSLREIVACGERPLTAVICVHVQDPTNLGAILRSSAALGADLALLSPRCADPFSRRVLRVSMGAVFRLPLVESADLQGDLLQLRDAWGVQLVAAVLEKGAERLEKAARPARLALLIGNEGFGLPPEIIPLCHRRVTLPMGPGADSLNAAVAAGVFLYHFTRVAPRPGKGTTQGAPHP